MFSQLREFVRSHGTLKSVRALLLNPHIRWADPQGAQAVVQYGLQQACIRSWKQSGTYCNVWLQAFALHCERTEQERQHQQCAQRFFLTLLRFARALVEARSFVRMQKAYGAFRAACLLPASAHTSGAEEEIASSAFASCSAGEDDAVMARCVCVLQELAALERRFAHVVPPDPYSFFVQQLAQQMYVPVRAGVGLAIFPYRVAAAAPFLHHFVINVSHEASSVRYQRGTFLRADVRAAFGFEDEDVTEAFLSAYATAQTVYFSCSVQAFSGVQRPNRFFSNVHPPVSSTLTGRASQTPSPAGIASETGGAVPQYPAVPYEEDALQAEQDLYAQGAPVPSSLYRTQQERLRKAASLIPAAGRSYIRDSFAQALPPLTAVLHARHFHHAAVKVSQTDLNLFFRCPAAWFLERVLDVAPLSRRPRLVDPRVLGVFSHVVLERLYNRIACEDECFFSAHMERYRLWTQEAIEQVFSERAVRAGPLVWALRAALSARIRHMVEFVLQFDAQRLDGWRVVRTEKAFEFTDTQCFYTGLVDRISCSPDARSLAVLDYKTGALPALSDYTDCEKKGRLSDFQIPMYVYLLEQAGYTVTHAFFLDVRKRDFKVIVSNGRVDMGAKRGVDTVQFQAVMQRFEQSVAVFSKAVRQECFAKAPYVTWLECASCRFAPVCRTSYVVRGAS